LFKQITCNGLPAFCLIVRKQSKNKFCINTAHAQIFLQNNMHWALTSRAVTRPYLDISASFRELFERSSYIHRKRFREVVKEITSYFFLDLQEHEMCYYRLAHQISSEVFISLKFYKISKRCLYA
jgi:hypothetical protein